MISMIIRSWFQKDKSDKAQGTDDLEQLVIRAKSGDEEVRRQLIEQYQPYIKKVISKVCKRYCTESMDEFSVGLLAFNEAIDQFKKDQGRFLSFASVVIQRRIIDYIRKEQRYQSRVVLAYDEETDDEGNQKESSIEQKTSIAHYEKQTIVEARVEEIKEYQKLLHSYDITFDVLVKQCPKHVDARENAKEIAVLIANSEDLTAYLQEKRRLPIKKLEELVTCSRKTIERNRKYIIAIALIHIGSFEKLKSYIELERGGE